MPLNPKLDPDASFQAIGGKTVVLTVNSRPSAAGARQEVVKCLDDEIDLRFKAWIEERRNASTAAARFPIGSSRC